MELEKMSEKTGLSARILKEIRFVAKKYESQKIVLFGSRARGEYQEKSDIDLAVYGCENFEDFTFEIEENVWTLLEFDLIDMENENISEELINEIERDGVVLYEKS